ncbi:Aste57867_17047 [Aphanomyces stellatus]|uniref:Aste57867_17047 protein n=1 Tax=Aphanomyces stellatus TaxID=120398 RepID=A0A485L772_9STRA|nr:hypothetical protein As57867_016989 [Aphanomyces stellatus]VFT93808.1 Aste57867_17047 [Aphanomyces stellatus]
MSSSLRGGGRKALARRAFLLACVSLACSMADPKEVQAVSAVETTAPVTIPRPPIVMEMDEDPGLPDDDANFPPLSEDNKVIEEVEPPMPEMGTPPSGPPREDGPTEAPTSSSSTPTAKPTTTASPASNSADGASSTTATAPLPASTIKPPLDSDDDGGGERHEAPVLVTNASVIGTKSAATTDTVATAPPPASTSARPTTTPSPTTTTPSPTTTTPSPTTTTPSPTTTTPSPTTIKASPTTTKSSPKATTPSPTTTTASPATSKSTDATLDPIDEQTTPKPVKPTDATMSESAKSGGVKPPPTSYSTFVFVGFGLFCLLLIVRRRQVRAATPSASTGRPATGASGSYAQLNNPHDPYDDGDDMDWQDDPEEGLTPAAPGRRRLSPDFNPFARPNAAVATPKSVPPLQSISVPVRLDPPTSSVPKLNEPINPFAVNHDVFSDFGMVPQVKPSPAVRPIPPPPPPAIIQPSQNSSLFALEMDDHADEDTAGWDEDDWTQ